jgi:hypothetical protein
VNAGSERVVIPSDALASLIQSEWGRDFLSAVMTDNTPRWWLQLKAWIGAVDLASAERKHRRKLRELLDDANQAPGAAALLYRMRIFMRASLFRFVRWLPSLNRRLRSTRSLIGLNGKKESHAVVFDCRACRVA